MQNNSKNKNLLKLKQTRFQKSKALFKNKNDMQDVGINMFQTYLSQENVTFMKEYKGVSSEKYEDNKGPFIVKTYNEMTSKKVERKDGKNVVCEEKCKITTLEGYVEDENSVPIYINVQKTEFCDDTIFEGLYKNADGSFVGFNSKFTLNDYQNDLVINALLKMFVKRKQYDKDRRNLDDLL